MAIFKIKDKETGKTFTIREKTDAPQKSILQKGFESVLQTPKTIAPALPIAGSIAGGASLSGTLPGIGMAIAGRGAGEQLKSEIQESPLRAGARVLEPAIPGLTGLTRAVSPEVTAQSAKETIKKIPEEVAFGVAGGLIGRVLRGFRPVGTKSLLRATEDISSELGKIQSSLSDDIVKIIDDFPETPINMKATNAALKELPENTMSFIRKNAELYNVTFLPNGTPVSSLRNMQNLKKAIADFVTSPKQWEEHTKAQIGAIKGVYRKIRNVMVEAQPALKKPLESYHNYMDEVYDYVKPLVKTSSGQAKEKTLRTALKPSADMAKKEALNKLGKMSKVASEATKTIKTFNKREALKPLLRRVGGLAALGGLGLAGFKGFRAMSD